jgi:hypothetical protein
MADVAIDWASANVTDGRDRGQEEEAAHRRVQPGAEADLRHLLASAFLQANAGTDDDESTDDAPTSSRSESDQALTDAFRAFSER